MSFFTVGGLRLQIVHFHQFPSIFINFHPFHTFPSSGGTNIGDDIRKLDYGQHIVCGTPGRVYDMIRRRNLQSEIMNGFDVQKNAQKTLKKRMN